MLSQSFKLSNYTPQNLLVWWSLAFQAGLINVGGYLACHRFVTHTTGFATLFGVELAEVNVGTALGMLAVPGFFILGAMYSGFLIERRILKGHKAYYRSLIMTVIGILLFVTAFGEFGFFGPFGEPLDIARDFILLALLCMVSGMQNASVTSASGAVLRTTHLTGVMTDLGIGLVLAGSSISKEEKHNQFRKNTIRAGLITSFVLGSAVGAFVFSQFKYLGFLLPTLFSVVLLYLLETKIYRAPEENQS